MPFTHQAKYRGCIKVENFYPSPQQKRPGLIEANQCVKSILSQVKQSSIVIISVSSENGIKCTDTSEGQVRITMKNTVYEIAHCGVDVSRSKMFTVIVGSSKNKDQYYCHVFKAESKDAAARICNAISDACTQAFQKHKAGGKSGGGKSSGGKSGGGGGGRSTGGGMSSEAKAKLEMQRKLRRTSLKKPVSKSKFNPKMTDDWFLSDATRAIVEKKLANARVGDFYVRESTTKIGNYAIHVQRGSGIKDLWQTLIQVTAAGGDAFEWQLGQKKDGKTPIFDDLCDLIAYYMENSFMKDAFGDELRLRPNRKQERASGGGADEMGAPAAAAGDWPIEDVDAILDAPGMTEEERQNAFMNSAHVLGPDSSDDDSDDEGPDISALTGALAEVEQKAAAEIDFNPRGGDPFGAPNAAAVDPFAAPAAPEPEPEPEPEPAAPAAPTNAQMAAAMMAKLPVDAEGFVGGNDVRGALLVSGLEMADLGAIWMMVDLSKAGKVNEQQLEAMLSLISLQQSGGNVSLESIPSPNTIPCPTPAQDIVAAC